MIQKVEITRLKVEITRKKLKLWKKSLKPFNELLADSNLALNFWTFKLLAHEYNLASSDSVSTCYSGSTTKTNSKYHQCSLFTVQQFFFFFYLRFVRSATVTRPARRPAVEVLWPTARTSLWPLRCQSWPARYTEPTRQPSAAWSPRPITQHSHCFSTAAFYKEAVSRIYFRSYQEMSL